MGLKIHIFSSHSSMVLLELFKWQRPHCVLDFSVPKNDFSESSEYEILQQCRNEENYLGVVVALCLGCAFMTCELGRALAISAVG